MSTHLRACVLAAIAASLCACSYDLSRLRGTGDAGDVIDENTSTDGDDGPIDAPPPCVANPPLDANSIGSMFGTSFVVRGTTVGAPSVLTPPTDTVNCTAMYAANPAPEQIYRYVVQQGPRLYATTDAPSCIGEFDTVVYFLSSCDQRANVLACQDDDHVLAVCGDNTGYESGAIVDGLHPGDTIYVVVDGYAGSTGAFRLELTENGVPNAAPPSVVAPNADRCSCPDTRSTMLSSITFPSTTDAVTGSSGVLQLMGSEIHGTHMLPFTHFSGVSLEFQLASNQLGVGTDCATAAATLDLSIGGHVVQSFVIDASTPVGTPQRVAFQTFGPIDLGSASTDVAIQLRTPATGCGGIAFDTIFRGTLTLLGGN